MGRRKQKRMVFVQGDSLSEEALDSDVEGQPGGLHIGSIVVTRAPLSSRRPAHLPGHGTKAEAVTRGAGGSRGVSAARHASINRLQEIQNVEHLLASDDSLDDELRDYLDNIKQGEQYGESDSTAASDDDGNNAHHSASKPPVAATDSSLVDWEDGSSARPGLGFHSAAAAARFADVRLDSALEGVLARDMASLGTLDSDTDADSSDYDDSSSSDADELDASAAKGADASFAASAIDASAAVLVDAAGQPMAVWDQLPLHQRFPVQARIQQGSQQDDRRSSSKKGKTKKHHKSPGRRYIGNSGLQSTTSMLPSDLPVFASASTRAAVTAAYSAAVVAADSTAVQRQQQRREQKSVVKGAKRGQLLPGEKAKLRKEKIAAKRATRQSDRGQSALALLAAVEEFALSGSDMTMLPPCGKHKQGFTRALAALYGVQASAQGGSSSGRTCLVLTATPKTAPLNEEGALRLQQLLANELQQELQAEALLAGSQQQQQQSNRPDRRRSSQQHLSRQGSRSAAEADMPRLSVFQQPVAFVSAGILDANSSSRQVEQQQAAAAFITSAAVAATDTAYVGVDATAAMITEPAVETAGVTSVTVNNISSITAAVPTSLERAGGAAGVRGSLAASAEVASFLESLLLDGEQQQQAPPAAGPPASQQPEVQQKPQHERCEPHQQQQAMPGWVIDREPWPEGRQHVGLGCIDQAALEAAASEVGQRPAQEAGCIVAAATANAPEAGCTVAVPLYDRAPLHMGLGFGSSMAGLGLVQQPKQDLLHADDKCIHTSAAAAASGSGRLHELEQKFAVLRSDTNPAASKRQQRKQQRLEARLAAPNTAMGPAVETSADAADALGESGITLGLTLQQVKKAKKQQQRNMRREARTAAAAEAGSIDAVAVGSQNVSASFAGFEAHTTGIGSRLMAGWGWKEGEGLGRARQGRPEPLHASRRARQLGLGAE